MDPVKCGYADEDELTEAHDQCDVEYLIRGNRQFVTILHDAVYPTGSSLYVISLKSGGRC